VSEEIGNYIGQIRLKAGRPLVSKRFRSVPKSIVSSNPTFGVVPMAIVPSSDTTLWSRLTSFKGRWEIQGVLVLLFLGAAASGPAGGTAQAQDRKLSAHTVTVAAGDVDRRATVVSFPLPTTPNTAAYHLEAGTGRALSLQIGEGRAWFVLDHLQAGRERTYQIEAGAASGSEVTLRRRAKTVDISIGDTPVLRYWAEPRPVPPNVDSIYERGGYLHPVRTPSGRVITGDYPEDHRHHHGLWSAWTETRFRGQAPDFWNMGDGTGAVRTMALDSTWNGPVQAGLTARHRYVDHTGPAPLTGLYEEWTLRVYRVSTAEMSTRYRLFDLVVTQTTASASSLILPKYRYGGVAVRGPDAWYGNENARFLTSAGRTRADGNRSRARWNYFGGTVDGKQAGIAMLGHPTNFRAPQPLRIPPEMPYFTFAPSQLGPWRIAPGRPYEARYRFVMFDGAPDPALLDRLWTDYAYPPTVTVQPVD
jgi:hypothetical protein